MFSFVAPEDRARAAENLKKTFLGNDLGANEYTLSTKNGTTFSTLVGLAQLFTKIQ